MPTDSTPVCYLKYNLSRVGDAFDFEPELTSAPRAPEAYETKLEDVVVARYISGGEVSADLIAPDVAEPTGPHVEHIEFTYQHIDLDI